MRFLFSYPVTGSTLEIFFVNKSNKQTKKQKVIGKDGKICFIKFKQTTEVNKSYIRIIYEAKDGSYSYFGQETLGIAKV